MTAQLFAPEAYWKTPEGERRRWRCGPNRGLLEVLVPETIYGLRVSPACSIHDFMYSVGETIADKDEADRVFLNNMIRLIEDRKKFRVLVVLRLKRAFKYYEFVKHFGGPFYWVGKNKPSEVGVV